MSDTSSIRAKVVRRLGTVGAVLLIAAASSVGLHDWADAVATHGTSSGLTSQDSNGP